MQSPLKGPVFLSILLQKSTYIYEIWAHTELSAIRNLYTELKDSVTVIHIIFSLAIFITFFNYEMFPPVFRVNNNKKPWKILAVLLIYAWASVFRMGKDLDELLCRWDLVGWLFTALLVRASDLPMPKSQPERIELYIEAQAFLRSYDSAPRRPPPPPLPSVSWTGDTK